MKLLLEHGRVLSGNTFVQDCPILIEDDTILAVGEVVETGELVKDLKVGDKVIYSKYAGNEVKLDDEEYIIVKQSDILAIVE